MRFLLFTPRDARPGTHTSDTARRGGLHESPPECTTCPAVVKLTHSFLSSENSSSHFFFFWVLFFFGYFIEPAALREVDGVYVREGGGGRDLLFRSHLSTERNVRVCVCISRYRSVSTVTIRADSVK